MGHSWDESSNKIQMIRGHMGFYRRYGQNKLSETSRRPLGNLSETSSKPLGTSQKSLAQLDAVQLSNCSAAWATSQEIYQKKHRNGLLVAQSFSQLLSWTPSNWATDFFGLMFFQKKWPDLGKTFSSFSIWGFGKTLRDSQRPLGNLSETSWKPLGTSRKPRGNLNVYKGCRGS